MKKEKHFMELNHETAMRLWNKHYGKATKAIDFSGREIAKGSYNDRNSNFGWNVDHILPQSRGGKTADHNLVCCHILTNDEKADKFPVFTANKKKFEIRKVENHFEIMDISTKTKRKFDQNGIPLVTNFYDSADGIRCFNKLRNREDDERFVGTIFITMDGVSSNAIVEFINKIFNDENISFKTSDYGRHYRIVAKNYDLPFKNDISSLLDKCILLNTYLSIYFVPMGYVGSYEIHFRVDHYDEIKDILMKDQSVDVDNSYSRYMGLFGTSLENRLFINELVRCNTDACEKELRKTNFDYFDYSYYFTKLAKNLDKEVKKN